LNNGIPHSDSVFCWITRAELQALDKFVHRKKRSLKVQDEAIALSLYLEPNKGEPDRSRRSDGFFFIVSKQVSEVAPQNWTGN